MKLVALVLSAAAVLTAVGHAVRHRHPPKAPGLFAPHSYRNTPLSAQAPIDPLSSSYVLDLTTKIGLHGVWVNTSSYSTPVYTVPRKQRTRRVLVQFPAQRQCGLGRISGNPCLAVQWKAVPLPRHPVQSPGNDGALVVYQPATDTFWEFAGFHLALGQPVAFYGGRVTHASRNPGYYTAAPGPQFGASATSIPLLVGLQRISELQRGAINHVVSFSMFDPHAGFRWPAERGDGTNLLSTAAPEGTCFRFPAGLDLRRYGLTQYGLTLARAIQRYGMVMTDRGSNGIDFIAEEARGGSDPYAGPRGIFHGGDPGNGPNGVLRNMPWNQLQALAAGTC